MIISKTLVIVPTYNEYGNIAVITEAIFVQKLGVDILVVDDNSPDGTGLLVQELMMSQPQLHLLKRQKKAGLGRAYIAGFEWGLAQGFDVFVEMDADFSHRPEDLRLLLTKLLAKFEEFDFVVGSRYIEGGRVVNWGFFRKFISKGGSLYARWVLGFPLRDWTGGFNVWKKNALEKIGLSDVKSNGYSFQIELKYRALKAGCKGVEAPIVFEDRRVGQSKMSLKIVLEAFYRVWLFRRKA